MPAAQVYPITQHPRFELLSGVGEFTSACGITFYRGSVFVAEPAHNLVHQDQILDSGSLYAATRAQNNSEFLASTDAVVSSGEYDDRSRRRLVPAWIITGW